MGREETHLNTLLSKIMKNAIYRIHVRAAVYAEGVRERDRGWIEKNTVNAWWEFDVKRLDNIKEG